MLITKCLKTGVLVLACICLLFVVVPVQAQSYVASEGARTRAAVGNAAAATSTQGLKVNAQAVDTKTVATTNNATNDVTRDTKVQDTAARTVASTVDATYGGSLEEFTYIGADGKEVTVKLADIPGLTKVWLDSMGLKDGDKVKIGLGDDKKALVVTKYDESGKNKAWEYDSLSHTMSHYYTEGSLQGKLNYVTVDSTRKYTFRGEGKDPGMGEDGRVIVKQCTYDKNGNLTKAEYYTWSAGDRGKGKPKKDDKQRYTRYKYREDTYKPSSTCEVTANCQPSSTKYFDDPRPISWEPTIKGTVVQDGVGRFFLKVTNEDKTVTYYQLVARQDGLDVDGDGTSGADELTKANLSTMVGKEITVRGHMLSNDKETDTFYNQEAAEMFAVVDLITTDAEQQKLDAWKSSGLEDKITNAMANAFATLGNENDTNKIYDKVYASIIKELKKAGVTEADIDQFATQKMKDMWGSDSAKSKKQDASGAKPDKAAISQAVEAFKNNNIQGGKDLLQGVINQFQQQAVQQQSGLQDFPALDNLDQFSALNLVGMSNYLLGQQAMNEGNIQQATDFLQSITDSLKFAQYSNPDNPAELWKLADKARELLDRAQNTQAATVR